MRNKLFVLLLSFGFSTSVFADEGMWLLTMLNKNYKDMKSKGLKLKPQDIYDINNSSLKDAVCTMNGGSCTAEVISSEGLLLTNHHCGYGAIQQFSSEENDYLTDGFWAMDRSAELHVPGMTMTFLVRVEDVTAKALEGVTDTDDELTRSEKIRKNYKKIAEEATKDTHYEAVVKPFYNGNDHYLFVNETFKDIRLVGAPPSSVGKYGGDTDNWMWPRHTGDFSMFRIYAGADNKPADHSTSNKPYSPKHHLPVNISGVQPGDYAMILGYPGSTDRFLTSYGVKLAVEKDQPARVKIRGKKLELMKNEMDKSDKVRIQYASKYAQVSNYWKYFIGQSEQLVRNKVYDKKKAIEDRYQTWADATPERKAKYGNVIKDIAAAYEAKEGYWAAQTYLQEAIFGPDVNVLHWTLLRPMQKGLDSEDESTLKTTREQLKEAAKGEFFKDYNSTVDENIFAAMLKMYSEDVPAQLHPEMLTSINTEYKGDWERFAKEYYATSIFTDETRFMNAIDTLTGASIEADKGHQLMNEFIMAFGTKVRPLAGASEASLKKAMRLFVDGLRQMDSDALFAPDANSTMRLTYGNVNRYKGKDGVIYDYYTTIDGLMAKEDPNNPEFTVPSKLKDLYNKRDFGKYGQDGTLRVCFISNNDITGGNSGSPVINGNGELIGCAFDGNWEAMSGDIAFEDELQRTISVDIRYVLFIIDKYAGATHLVDEMTLVTSKKKSKKKCCNSKCG